MFMLDLCAGTGSASRAMARRGWQVVTVDLDPATGPDIVADVRGWSWDGPRPDLVWAAPPYNLSVILACQRIITECNPRFSAVMLPGSLLPSTLGEALAVAIEHELGAF